MIPAQPTNSPIFAVRKEYLVPVNGYLREQEPIPPSRMFLINKSLRIYKEKNPGANTFDASQGDGGASLPGVLPEILERAYQMQVDRGTAYDMPYGSDAYRKSVIEKYWKLDSNTGINPTNVIATVGGRDALMKAYQAMLALGYGREGDVIIVTRVPWISYSWGPYGIGANVLWAPGEADQGWMYTEDAIRESVVYAARAGRNIAGLVITCPDNPTGLTISAERQAGLAKAALDSGVAFVLFDWMYHYVTDGKPNDLNSFLSYFDAEERNRLMFLDGITKSLGASNIRNCHLISSEEVIKYTVARASHGVIPSFYSMAVAMAAYEMGYSKAAKGIIEPTNASRVVLKNFLDQHGFRYILGKGYYAFIHIKDALAERGWSSSEPLGQYLAEEHGIAIVPGSFFSPYGDEWVRFSYATPPEYTLGAAKKLLSGLQATRD
jgi:aspartate aminotransferase